MLLMIAISLLILQSQVRCQVTTIDVPEINRNCDADRDEVCDNLYFYDDNDVLLHVVQGTDARIKRGEGGVKRVAKVQTMGDYGCYTIFEKTNFRSTNLCWNHTDRLNIMEAGYGHSVVRSVEYDPGCDCQSQARRGRKVFGDLPPIDPYCRDEVCANLYFYDENDVLLHTVHGTNARIKGGKGVKGVAKVQTVGDHGCYTIFKGRDFRSSSHCWNHMDRLNIGEAGYDYSRVRSVKYDPACNC